MKGKFCCSVFLLLVLATLYILTMNEMNLWQPTRTVRTEGSKETLFSKKDNRQNTIHDVYDGVQALLVFIGYPRSGHTLVSSLLDAHPHVIIANEFDIIGKWKEWDIANRNKYFLFDQLYQNSKQESEIGYRSATVKHRYSYHVPRQWQGTYSKKILVMGAKKGGKTTRQLFQKENVNAVLQIEKALKIPIKYIHVIRNPYDNIATMLLRKLNKRPEAEQGEKINDTHSLNQQIGNYFTLARLNSKLKTRFEGAVHRIHSLQLIKEPQRTLLGVCQFLKLHCDQQYIKDCSSIIYKEPTKTRHSVVWTDKQKELVMETLKNFPSLKDYNFDN